MLLTILGRAVLVFFSLLGVINVIDVLTAGGESKLLGGSPIYESDAVAGRDVVFPKNLQQGGRRAAVLDEDYYFCSRNGDIMRIPRGFKTDFASIPDIGRVLIDRFGWSIEPAVIHDWLYAIGEGTTAEERESHRGAADRIFLEALEDNGVGLATRSLMFAAVRLFGHAPYEESEKWDGRIVDPATGQPFENQVFAQPKTGVLDTIGDCKKFFASDGGSIRPLVACYSTDERFISVRDREDCQLGDRLYVPRPDYRM